jgi:DNA-binding response OmpR family regulator
MAPFKLQSHEQGSRSPLPLARKSILIIEDEPLVALDVHGAVSAAGASIISAASETEAISLIGHADISAAIVDIGLGAHNAAGVCRRLERRRTPFLFYTGYTRARLLTEWPNVPVLEKPARPQEIVTALVSLMRCGGPHMQALATNTAVGTIRATEQAILILLGEMLSDAEKQNDRVKIRKVHDLSAAQFQRVASFCKLLDQRPVAEGVIAGVLTQAQDQFLALRSDYQSH